MPNLQTTIEMIENKIHYIRGQKVMLDRDLAMLYGVKTKTLNQAVKRNIKRFPKDFMFQLNWAEASILRSQFVTLEKKRSKIGKHIKYLPFAFSEQGVAMLSSVLKSERAITVNILIMRVFSRLRQMILKHAELSKKVFELENKVSSHNADIRSIFNAIRILLAHEEKPRKRIGFKI
jgi:hypothetical protein